MRDALERWYGPESGRNRDVMYYLTVYNEPIHQPAEPDDVDVEGIIKGIHRLSGPADGDGPEVQLLASGVALPWIEQARRLLAEDWGVRASTWSVTSWNELRRDALAAERENFLNPTGEQRVPFVTSRLQETQGPFIATSDYDHLVADQIRKWVPGSYHTLGADGFGALDDHCAILQGLLLGGGALGGDRLPAFGGDGLERGEAST